MTSRHKHILTAVLALTVLALGLCLPVYGEEIEDGKDISDSINSASPTTLQIKPVSVRMALEPGKIIERTFTVTNGTSAPYEFRVYATPYSAGGKEYSNDFVSQTQYTKISDWIEFINPEGSAEKELTFTLDGKQSTDIKYRITVPEDIAGGGQYACIFAETVDENIDKEGIKTITRTGLTVFGSVDAETRHQVKFGDIDVNPVLYKGKINVSSDIENVGNIDFQTSLDVSIKSVFGKELYNHQVINTVLPDTTRNIFTEWNDTPYFGIFRLHSTVSALGTEVNSDKIILVMPPLMIALTIVLFSAIAISVTIYIRRKKESPSQPSQGSSYTSHS